MSPKTLSSVLRDNWLLAASGCGLIFCCAVLAVAVFVRGERVMRQEIRERLRGVAAAAAMQFDAEALEGIRGPTSMESPAFIDAVTRLRDLRESVPGIRYAYILRRTDDPAMAEFVADADSLSQSAESDVDGDGIVDPEEEPSYPGDLYDVAEIPALRDGSAYAAPAADADVTVDQWGVLISGYAPIRTARGDAVAVLGIDMRAEEFLQRSRSVFSPLALAASCGGAFLMICGLILQLMRKRVQALERLSAERSGLLQLTFHQLGEPLTILKWSAEMVQECVTDKEKLDALPEHMAYVQESIVRIGGIVDALCEAEQVDRGTIAYAPVDAEAETLADEAARRTGSAFAAKKQDLRRDIHPIVVRADPARIVDVLCKLLQNAADYSPDGSAVTLRVERRGNRAVFSVEDSGEGIAPSELPHVAEKYVRGSKARLTRPDGKGLSLFTARGVIERAGGKMWIRSAEGKGTSVFFTLPLAKE